MDDADLRLPKVLSTLDGGAAGAPKASFDEFFFRLVEKAGGEEAAG